MLHFTEFKKHKVGGLLQLQQSENQSISTQVKSGKLQLNHVI